LKAYLSIFRLRFTVQLQYRAAAVAAFFTQFFFGFIIVMVFHAFYAASDKVQPMSLAQTVTYAWLVQTLLRLQPGFSSDTEVVNMVRSGNIAYELCRPLDLYFLWFARLLSLRIVPTMLSGIPLFLIALLLPAGYGAAPPASFASGGAWLLSMVLSLLLGCAISNLITASALWTIAGDGMQRIFPAVIMVFSGINVPLAFFPDWAQTILRILPFSGLVDLPFRLYLGMVPASSILVFGLLQSFWIAVFVLVGMLVLRSGKSRVAIQGG
jgi:ABC-2 type transport system permease protein